MGKKVRVKFHGKEKSRFQAVLRERVNDYFKEQHLSPHANIAMVIKSIVLIGAYILPFVLLLTWAPSMGNALLLWVIMGIGVAGIGMSVMHDANHGAYSKYPVVNFIMGHTLNIIGGSVLNWKLQHNILHHTYTNIAFLDDDIEDRLVLRFSPHSRLKKFHAYQWLYATIFYGFLTFYWALFKDFVQYFGFIKSGVNAFSPKENRMNLLKIIGIKLVYFTYIFVIPVFVLGFSFLPLALGFLLMHFVAGMILTIVFQLAHTVEGTSHPLPDAHGVIDNDWAIHQMNTTMNFAMHNKLITWYVGGLNYQVEHHLFPGICHVHYPQIAPIVEETAKEFGIPYLVNPTLGNALSAHFRVMYRFGREESPTSLAMKASA